MSFSGRRLFLETPNEIRGGQKTSCCPLRHGKSAAIHIPLPRIAGLDDRGLAQPHADASVLCTGKGFGGTLRVNHKLSDCCREGCNFTFAEC